MDEGLALIIFALDIFMLNNKCSFPKRHSLLSVKIILKYDANQHCDNYFKQIEGGAMANPFTCTWTVVRVALLEIMTCKPLFKKLLLLTIIFIDDAFLV